MPPSAVVPHLDILEQIPTCCFSCRPSGISGEFTLERRKEAFYNSIVPAVTAAAHAGIYSIRPQERLVGLTGVLHTPVRVIERTRQWATLRDCHAKRAEGQLLIYPFTRAPAYDAPRSQIEYDGQV
jgi:hypothetical protein